LALQPGQKDNSDSWGVVFEDLIKRGLKSDQVRIGVMDGQYFTNAVTARCWVHAKKNAVLKCPARMRLAFETLLNEVMYAQSEFEKKFWRVLKTTNPIERVNKELKRRTKSMETVGDKPLNILLAFTAMRLEYNWQRLPVDSEVINNLKPISKKNQIDEVLEKLIH
jgi:transposase-like protein